MQSVTGELVSVTARKRNWVGGQLREQEKTASQKERDERNWKRKYKAGTLAIKGGERC